MNKLIEMHSKIYYCPFCKSKLRLNTGTNSKHYGYPTYFCKCSDISISYKDCFLWEHKKDGWKHWKIDENGMNTNGWTDIEPINNPIFIFR